MSSNGKDEEKHYTQLVLTLDIAPTWHVHIGGNIENADVALAVLNQAVRYFEAQLRAQAALQMQEQLARAASERAIADALRKTR